VLVQTRPLDWSSIGHPASDPRPPHRIRRRPVFRLVNHPTDRPSPITNRLFQLTGQTSNVAGLMRRPNTTDTALLESSTSRPQADGNDSSVAGMNPRTLMGFPCRFAGRANRIGGCKLPPLSVCLLPPPGQPFSSAWRNGKRKCRGERATQHKEAVKKHADGRTPRSNNKSHRGSGPAPRSIRRLRNL
jgi:hypothetical protein